MHQCITITPSTFILASISSYPTDAVWCKGECYGASMQEKRSSIGFAMASGFCIFFGNLAEQYALALAGVTIAVPMFSSCIVVLGAPQCPLLLWASPSQSPCSPPASLSLVRHSALFTLGRHPCTTHVLVLHKYPWCATISPSLSGVLEATCTVQVQRAFCAVTGSSATMCG